jgi:hypothetical protein
VSFGDDNACRVYDDGPYRNLAPLGCRVRQSQSPFHEKLIL